MKRILPLLLFCLALDTAHAQEAKACFTAMPDSITPLLTAVNRADCIDFIESGMKAEVTNRFEGKTVMTQLTPDYIRLRMTGQSTWQMKLLSTADSTRIICTVFTACASACDSDIRFYTTQWQELPTSRYLPSLPVLADFINEETDSEKEDPYSEEEDGDKHAQTFREADMLLMQADLSPDDATLTFTCTTPAYREKEVAERLSACLGKPVVYRWQARAFQKE
ncbi:MAG: DUF3256 family protein [Prevotellaceae bacterium]|nr:DUF3256 family protein [Prevotellaceae bacterium]